MPRFALPQPARPGHLAKRDSEYERCGNRESLTDALGAEVGAEVWSRFTVHYTPRNGSRLNQQAAIEIGLLARQCLGNRCMPNLQQLQRESSAWNRRMKRDEVLSTGGSHANTPARRSVTIRTLSRGRGLVPKLWLRSRFRLITAYPVS